MHELQECYTQLEQCKDSRNLLEAYHCHLKGRFPHPTKANLFLLCPDVGYRACLCHCEYEEMCFDITQSSCKFQFLGDVADCARPLPVTAYSVSYTKIQSTNSDYTSDDPSILKTNSSLTPTVNISVQSIEKDNPVQKYDGILNNTAQRFNFTVHIYASKTDDKEQEHNTVQQTTSSSTQGNAKSSSIISDKSGFPAWMFTLVILCLIILIVLVVLYIH